MKSRNRFPHEILESIRTERIIAIRAGSDSAHRVIGIWAVVVLRRVFLRSWSMRPRSWWRTFLGDPQGSMTAGTKAAAIRAIQTRRERLEDLVSAAYKQKYDMPVSLRFANDMSRRKWRDTTKEPVPA